MPDVLTAAQRRRCMSRIGANNTNPELRVRGLLHALGYRYRLHRRDLPGTPDIVFPARRKVIFVHGCFWHRHSCKSGSSMPRTNRGFWKKKLSRNVARDRKNLAELADLGWHALIVWECETRSLEEHAPQIQRFLDTE